MNQKKFEEIGKAKVLALMMAITIIVLYITKGLLRVPEILMFFSGIASFIRIKISGISLFENKSSMMKGIYFSLAGVFLGFLIKKMFFFDLIVELILLVMVFAVLKELYFGKEEKWTKAFVLQGSFLVVSGIVLFLFSLAEKAIV